MRDRVRRWASTGVQERANAIIRDVASLSTWRFRIPLILIYTILHDEANPRLLSAAEI